MKCVVNRTNELRKMATQENGKRKTRIRWKKKRNVRIDKIVSAKNKIEDIH